MSRCVKCSPHREHSHSKHTPSLLRLLTSLSHWRCLQSAWRVCRRERLWGLGTDSVVSGEAWEPAVGASRPGDTGAGGLGLCFQRLLQGLSGRELGVRIFRAAPVRCQPVYVHKACHRGDIRAHWPMLNEYFCVLSMLPD